MGLLGAMTSRATKAAAVSVDGAVDELVTRYRSDAGWRAATARTQQAVEAGLVANERYQRAEGGVTSSDPEVDRAIGKAQRAEADARRAASEAVRPGFIDLQQATAAAMAAALAEVLQRQSDLAQIEMSAQSCGVRLTTVADTLPDPLQVADWQRRCARAGRS